MNNLERFMSHVHFIPESGCWITDLSGDSDGYGQFRIHRHSLVKAHRWSYENFIGPIPQGFYVCHKCDVSACVNPAHLFAGSPQDNIDDKLNKNRQAFGERMGTARLTEAQVMEIKRADFNTQGIKSELARKFGVSRQAIYNVMRGKLWKHVRDTETLDA